MVNLLVRGSFSLDLLHDNKLNMFLDEEIKMWIRQKGSLRKPGLQIKNSGVLHLDVYESPVGPLLLGVTQEAVALVEFKKEHRIKESLDDLYKRKDFTLTTEKAPLLTELKKQLTLYFKKELKEFDLPLELVGTDFQKKVWKCLKNIPFGQTWSYKKQSRILDEPKAIRAVACANGKNRLAILIPCHRVLGTDGSLRGYAGGLDKKAFLLKHETT